MENRALSPESAGDMPLVAYEIYSQSDMPLIPAPLSREWMDRTQLRFAYRCLPLALANQAGWMICSPASFSARWNGGPRPEDTLLAFDQIPPDKRVSSLFGHGVVTFNIPYIFRTPPRVNLWVKGPTNWPKDGAHPLEGLVETDWTSASFTMNWKLTRAKHLVRFERGEPICMIVPYPRGFLEACQPERRALSDNAQLAEDYHRWSRERSMFHELVANGDEEAIRKGWQKDYFQGHDPGADRFPDHQTKLSLRPFGPAP